MSELINRSSDLLRHMYDPDSGLFSYSTSIVDGEYRNDFSHPKAQRYTINTLAGLWRLEQTNPGLWDFRATLESYLRHQRANIVDPGDKGLLLYVLSNCGDERAKEVLKEVLGLVGSQEGFRGQLLQDACWQLYGLIAYAQSFGDSEAESGAVRCFEWLQRFFMDDVTLMPRHQSFGIRKRFVSFGGLTYFLKALFEYGNAFGDDSALDLFRKGVRTVIARQGPNGEWAWFYDSRTGNVVDWYEVYSVHQEAMSMLFLLPALDIGLDEAQGAIEKSVAWLFGANELDMRIMTDGPFFSYRSIRRKGSLQRQRRIARAITLATTGRSAAPAETGDLEVNTECRSYEMGWTVYAWAGRKDFPAFTGLESLE